MWRRIYLCLLLVRVFFAVSPSYLHPDEVFQGPEIVAGYLFPYPSHQTWEWTSAQPIRSVFPLWLFYGLPMSLLKNVWTRESDGLVEPAEIYYALRLVMFILSFVLEDWAIHELVHSPRRRKLAVLLVASSYVTWTFQTHTFSNSIETLLVLWSLVLIERIATGEKRTSIASSFVLGFLFVLGVFNRITFPAFVLIPGMRLLPYFLNRPLSLLAITASAFLWTFIAIATDTAYYSGDVATKSFRSLFTHMQHNPVITPLNNVMYNTQTANLAQHGLHPRYQHIIINLPQLLGPAMILLLSAVPHCAGLKFQTMLSNPRLTSAATGALLLSIMPHQEPRFLLPCIPLLLTCIQLPTSPQARRYFWISWWTFNGLLAILMGVYHQGGIIPAQINMPDIITRSLAETGSKASNIEVFWWKTYPPPTYLLGSSHSNPTTTLPLNIQSIPLMGISQSYMQQKVAVSLPACQSTFLDRISSTIGLQSESEVFLAAPLSAWRLPAAEKYPSVSNFSLETRSLDLNFEHRAIFRQHVNLDDMDFGDDGVLATLSRVIGRRGLGIWRVQRACTVEQEDR